LINNRQVGRRRGRGGNGGGGNGGGQRQGRSDNGNRIDNRARGNAAQLLEKYKNLASDAQRQGDRVNTEYYLQFADHYFRVLGDQRGRFEDQQARRQRDEFDGDGEDEFVDEGEPIRAGEQQMEANPDRAGRDRQGDRRPRREDVAPVSTPVEVGGQHRADAIDAGEPLDRRAEQVLEADAPLSAPARRRGRPRRDAAPGDDASPVLDADRLPPALMNPANDAAPDDLPKLRRRGRPPRVTPETPSAVE